MKIRCCAILLVVCVLVFIQAPAAKANGFLPIVQPYESFNDSPFKTMSFSAFQLVDMTKLQSAPFPNGLAFNGQVPGVTTDSNAVVISAGPLVDSVDGLGNAGNSLFDFTPSLTFSFDRTLLGYLPTAAGIAWTDGILPITFSATDALGNSLGQIVDNNPGDFSEGDGNPEHFRFYGIINSAGISSITISSNAAGGIEVDHLQFGLLSTPEPSTAVLTFFSAGFFLLIFRRLRMLPKSLR
jgi:hypothetical protein